MGLLQSIIQWVFIGILMIGISIGIIIYRRKLGTIPKVDRSIFVENQRAEYTDQHAFGWLQKIERCKNGVSRISFLAIDKSKEQRDKNMMIVKTVLTDLPPHTTARGNQSGYVNKLTIPARNFRQFISQTPLVQYGEIDTKELLKANYVTERLIKEYGFGYETVMQALPTLLKRYNTTELQDMNLEKFTSIIDTIKKDKDSVEEKP